MIIEQDGFEPVECSIPLPCPFCGGVAVLKQLEHVHRLNRKGKVERIYIVASSRIQKGNTFWFACESCNATSGGHQETAQAAVNNWNRRSQ